MALVIARDALVDAMHRVHEFVTSNDFANRLNREVRTRNDYLQQVWDNFQQAHVQLLESITDVGQRDPHRQILVEVENEYLTANAIMQERIQQMDDVAGVVASEHEDSEDEHDARPRNDIPWRAATPDPVGANNAQVGMAPLNVQMGQIPPLVPPISQWPWQLRIENIWGEFDGDKKKWPAFHDSFKARVCEDPTMPPVQKFQILRAALKGKAMASLGEWQVCDQNFEPAWKRLKQLYDDPYTTSKELLAKLLNLDRMDESNGAKLQKMSNVAQEVARQLGAMGYQAQHFDMIFIHIVQSKLDQKTSVDWDLARQNDKPTLDQFTEFLDRQARALSNAYLANSLPNPKVQPSRKRTYGQGYQNDNNQSNKKNYQRDSKRSKPNLSGGNQVAVKLEKHVCAACGEYHFTRKCQQFLKLSLTKKKEKAQKAKLCYNCLNYGHTSRDCKQGVCNRCERKHNSLLCPENPQNRQVNTGKLVVSAKQTRKQQKRKPKGQRD